MRRVAVVVIVFLSSFFLFTISGGEITNGSELRKNQYIEDYFPNRILNIRYDGIYDSMEVSKVSGDKVIIKQIDSEKITTKVYKVNRDDIMLVYSREGTDDRIDELNMESNRKEVILKAPLKVGTTWVNDDGKEFTITGINKRIITSCGIYETIEVTCKWGGFELKNYYAGGVGLVRIVERNRNAYKTILEVKSVEIK